MLVVGGENSAERGTRTHRGGPPAVRRPCESTFARRSWPLQLLCSTQSNPFKFGRHSGKARAVPSALFELRRDHGSGQRDRPDPNGAMRTKR